ELGRPLGERARWGALRAVGQPEAVVDLVEGFLDRGAVTRDVPDDGECSAIGQHTASDRRASNRINPVPCLRRHHDVEDATARFPVFIARAFDLHTTGTSDGRHATVGLDSEYVATSSSEQVA